MTHVAEAERPPYERIPSSQSRALAAAIRLGIRPFSGRVKGGPAGIRLWRTLLGAGSHCLRADPRVLVEPFSDPCVDEPRIRRPVRGEWLRPPGGDASRGAVLYLHGGAYAICSPRTHRVITTRLAMETGMPVLAPRYRQAPEHPFPAAFEDALDAYRLLLARGIPAERITLVGDSSGGHLAAALTGEACRTDLPTPGKVVLFSPWIDLTGELATTSAMLRRDPFIVPAVATRFGRLYVGTGDWNDPRLSILSCASADLPPFLIQVGGIEVLRDEAERFAEVLAEAGADYELQVWPGQMHVFQMFNGLIPEAGEAMREAARFIRRDADHGSVPEAA
ncbi:alpha/beta hydrolase [Actinoallomurus soli]|uniref:alpha/beta hydrolase n=1 Tax=Actinoallomurus soli TaxID=2952535 RepID=UPI002093D41D|nr:alpha/beta hydrolase [Actinoallomurus soli]MCO5968081.1 alpha/beta hydrolase [Actinoallomurus soli]